MKSYFSWKRFGAFAGISNRNEQPLVQGVVTDPQPSSCAVTLFERENFAAVQDRTTTDMMVRTIAVCTPLQETHNAALLCSFAVPAAGMNYLAYSLNESIGDEDVLVYIAALQCEHGRYRLETSVTDHAWKQAFGQIVGQSQGSQDATWHYIDIGQQPLSVTACELHASISVNKALVMGLFIRLGAADMGQAIECKPVASTRPEPVNNTPDAAQDSSALARFVDQGDDQDEQLDEVQESLNSIVAIAQDLEQRHGASTLQRQRLEEFQKQLLEKDRGLRDKERELAGRYAALLDAEGRATDLQARLQLLDEREAALNIRSEELALGHQKLSANRARFSSIVKKFHVAVQLKGVAPRHLNEVPVQQMSG